MRKVNLEEHASENYITKEGWHTVKIVKLEYNEEYDSYKATIRNREKEQTFVTIPLAENRLFILANILKALDRSLKDVDLDNLKPVLENAVLDLKLEYYIKENSVTGEEEKSKYLSIKQSRKASPKEQEQPKPMVIEDDDLPF